MTLALLKFSGEISAKYIGDKLDAAPTAKPNTNRKSDISQKFMATAQSTVAIVNTIAMIRSVLRRPILSATRPHPSAPKQAPITNELDTTPCKVGVKFSWSGRLMNASAPLITPVS